MKKVILDLCGGTGAWSRPYKKAGYTVFNITLPDYDLIRTGYECGGYIVFNGKKFIRIFLYDVYGILAAPDCAHFSFARQRAKTPRDIFGAFALVKKCREIIEVCAIEGNLKFWCLENPRGYLYKILGIPAFKFKPSDYGDPTNKITWLWGNFNFPKKLKTPVSVPKGKNRESLGYSRSGNKIKRAITPPGFARAFFKANK